MKKVMIMLLLLVAVHMSSKAQDEDKAISWNFYAVKIDAKTYEIHMSPTVRQPWHIYSQYSPQNGAVPAHFNFEPNPMIILQGKVNEVGRLTSKYEPLFKLTVKFFEGKVDFIQRVKLRTEVKTTVTGIVKSMICNDHECLPPATVPFTIELK